MRKEAISLVQPRHSYAPEKGIGHVYMPMSVLMPAARIMEAGGEVADIQDLNLQPMADSGHAGIVGVSLLGAPYIPEVEKQIVKAVGSHTRLAVGGQVVSGLTERQRHRLFGKNSIHGNDDAELSKTLGINVKDISPIYNTSAISAYERISDEDMKKYLSTEFSFYLAQGCKWHCPFCAVGERTKRNEGAGKMVAAKEIYRRPDILEKDLRYLVERAEKLGLSKLDIYLSNLDVFQTPNKLSEFAGIVLSIKKSHPHFSIRMRGLATVDAFIHADAKKPEAIQKIKEAGFHTVGFGIDGGTAEQWAKLKPQNTEIKCVDAFRIAREKYDITPEVLMVFGHPGETAESLKAAVTFTETMVEKYKAIPRPYVSKDLIPGNDYWMDVANAGRIEFLLKHPQYFQALDFAALPSSISHPDETLRTLTDKYVQEIIRIPGNITKLVYPIAPEFDEETNVLHRKLNVGNYDN